MSALRSLEARYKILADKLAVMYCSHSNGHYCEICAAELIAVAAAQVRLEALEAIHAQLGRLIRRDKKGNLIADEWGAAVAACQNEVGAALRKKKP